jgi:hypothetical protein
MSKTVPSRPYVVNTQDQNLLSARVLLVETCVRLRALARAKSCRLTAPRIVKNTIGFKIATGGQH